MWFYEHISWLVKSANGEEMKFTMQKMLANEVTINFNMLGSPMENIIVGNLNCTAIVTI
jgi:hypothetical protein